MNEVKIGAVAVFFAVVATPALAQYGSQEPYATQEPAAWASTHPEANLYSTYPISFALHESYAPADTQRRVHRARTAKLRRKHAAE